jgi:hydroxypyruvate isomerase
VLHNLPAGNWDGGERGIACHPDRTAEFRAGVAQAIAYAGALGVRQLNCLAGKAPAGVPDAQLRRTLVENLRYAAAALKRPASAAGRAHQHLRHPGLLPEPHAQALALLDEVGATTCSCSTTSTTCSAWKASWPPPCKSTWRASPTSSWPTTPAATSRARARSTTPSCSAPGRDRLHGWIGCEYKPAGHTTEGLGWIKALMP